jgi:hypothetical protein
MNACRPVSVLRVFSLVFFQVLDIASLTLFLMTMDCQYFSVPAEQRGINQEFPGVRECTSNNCTMHSDSPIANVPHHATRLHTSLKP